MNTDLTKAEVIKYFGGTVKTANVLGIDHSAVCHWGEYVPEGRAYQLQILTGGVLQARKLNGRGRTP